MNGENSAKRFLHAMTFDKVRNKFILYGGGNGEIIFGDTWKWNSKKWTRIC
jgi:hypothetical protein